MVSTPAGTSTPYSIIIAPAEPGLLAPSSFIVGGKQYLAALFSDGATYVLPPGAIAGLPAKRAQPGDNITLYGVGFGPVTPSIPAGQVVGQANSLAQPLTLMFGNTPATTTYAGLAPSAVGLYQFNVVVPNVPSNDLTPVTVTVNGTADPQVLYIAVQNGNPPLTIQSLALSPTSVAGGGTVQGTVTFSAPAPSGGTVVALSASSTAATVPATVTVAAGANSATFTVSTSAASSSQSVTITASYSGSSAQAVLNVTSSPGGGSLPQFSSINISGSNVTSSTAGIIPLGVQLVGNPLAGGTYFGSLVGGVKTSSPTTDILFEPTWSTVTVSGQSLIFNGLNISGSLMIMGFNQADITSAFLSVILTPQVVATSGIASGSFSVTSTLATISGTFTGTYTAMQ